jgi:hypothetical protein
MSLSCLWTILRWIQLPIITDIAFVFTFHKFCVSVESRYILKYLKLLFWPNFCLPKLQRL